MAAPVLENARILRLRSSMWHQLGDTKADINRNEAVCLAPYAKCRNRACFERRPPVRAGHCGIGLSRKHVRSGIVSHLSERSSRPDIFRWNGVSGELRDHLLMLPRPNPAAGGADHVGSRISPGLAVHQPECTYPFGRAPVLPSRDSRNFRRKVGCSQTVAEGVENEEQLTFVSKLFIGRPVPAIDPYSTMRLTARATSSPHKAVAAPQSR
ncbi:hypothetical protein QFZ99_005659 [Paraburkholderia atlantica]